jgi:hypothetical protein
MAAKKMTNEGSFLRFLTEHLHIDIPRLPKRAARRSGATVGDWLIPPFRFTSEPLVPAADFYPCDLCEFARYNALCARQNKCAPHAYWSMQKLEMLESSTPKRARAAVIRHLGLKVRRPKNEQEAKKKQRAADKQRKGKRVANNRSYKKPAAKRKKAPKGKGGRKRR